MRRLWNLIKQTTVEPVLFGYMVASWLNFPTFQGLYFLKVCLKEYNDTNFCENEIDNGSFKTQENYVHGQTSHWIFYDTLCITLPALIMAPYFGSWSDRISRKIPLIFPPIGALLGSINYIICSVYMDLPIALVLVSPLLNGLAGGFITTILAVFSYIGAVTTKENRNVRISVLESMSFLGGTVGLGLSGLLLNHLGFPTLFGIIMCFHVLIILYVLFVLPSVPVTSTRDPDTSTCTHLFSLNHVKDYVKCAFKARAYNGRRNLLIICFSLFLVFLCFAGTRDITYLFLKKSPISWNRSLYGYYQAYQNSVYFLALCVGTPLLKKVLGLSDPLLVIFGLLSTMSSLILLAFCTATWMVFLVPLVGVFHGYAAASSRALASQFVTKEEQGRIFAFIGSSETISSLLASAIFNSLYPVSLSFFSGLSFIVMACILLVSLLLVNFVHHSMKRDVIPYEGVHEGDGVPEENLSQENPAVNEGANS